MSQATSLEEDNKDKNTEINIEVSYNDWENRFIRIYDKLDVELYSRVAILKNPIFIGAVILAPIVALLILAFHFETKQVEEIVGICVLSALAMLPLPCIYHEEAKYRKEVMLSCIEAVRSIEVERVRKPISDNSIHALMKGVGDYEAGCRKRERTS